MADKISLDDIEKDRAALQKLCEEVADLDPNDTETYEAHMAKIQDATAKMQQCLSDFEAQQRATFAERYGDDWEARMEAASKGYFDVQLTAEQRARVKEETGTDMEVLRVDDPGGLRMLAMPHTPPEEIERMALEQARGEQATADAEAARKQQVEEAIAAIEDSSPEAKEKLQEILKDPEIRKILGMDDD